MVKQNSENVKVELSYSSQAQPSKANPYTGKISVIKIQRTDQAGNVGFARLSAHAAGEAATDDQETFLLKSS